MTAVIIDLQGVKQLRNKLGQFGGVIGEELEAYLTDVSTYVKDQAVAHAPRDLGAGQKSIYAQIVDRSSVMSVVGGAQSIAAKVATSKYYMEVQEFGRRPGSTPPSTNHIAGWGRRHGFGTKRAIYVLARSIGRKGFRGKHFLLNASYDGEKYARQRLNIIGSRLAVWFQR